MEKLCDDDLLDTFAVAIRLHLEPAFLRVLELEIQRRNLYLPRRTASEHTDGP